MHWIIQKTINFFKKTPEDPTALFIEKQDSLAAEVPVSLVYNGIAHTVMMCSPQDLEDFALGFSLAEGIIEKKADIYGIDVVEVCNGIEVQIELSSRQFVALKDHRRTLTGRTGCGICGTEQISQVYKKLPKLDHTFQFNLNLLDGCLEQLQANQELGKETGATHAAAFFDLSGNLLAIREDVGRHVALDKLIGWHAKQNQPRKVYQNLHSEATRFAIGLWHFTRTRSVGLYRRCIIGKVGLFSITASLLCERQKS